MSESVNHPEHYNVGGIECIDVIECAIGKEGAANFCMGNAIKYLYRHTMKGQPIEDVRKAIWYLNKWIELQDEQEHGYYINDGNGGLVYVKPEKECPFEEDTT